ncbi:MAG: preprotein translocase subunit SecG [Opitutaceae bacterium]
MNVILGILTVVLVLVSFFLVLVILMQKDKSGGGAGAAFGGGVAEATFGGETSNVLSKATINAAIAFFVLSTALFLARIYQHTHPTGGTHLLPTMTAPVPHPASANPFAIPAAPSGAGSRQAPPAPAGGARH